MKGGYLFAGIGGFELSSYWAGITPVWSNEIDNYCCKVLRKNFTHKIIEDDIRNIGKHNLEPVDIICGGFPCQPFSQAGKRRGAEDDRYLWPETIRIVSELRPSWFVGENVAGILSMEQPDSKIIVESESYVCEEAEMVTETIREDLARIGYESVWFVIPACAVGAIHRRDRIWIIANNNNNTKRSPSDSQVSSNIKPPSLRETERKPQQSPIFNTRLPYLSEVSPNSNSIGLQRGKNEQEPERGEESINKQFEGCDQLFRQNWEKFPTESPVRRRDDGLPYRMDKHRIKALGNAIVPQVAYEILKSITISIRIMANTLTINKDPFIIPSSWEELTYRERLLVLQYVVVDSPQNRLEILRIVGGEVLLKSLRSFAHQESLESDRSLKILSLIDWMYTAQLVEKPTDNVHPIIEKFMYARKWYWLPMWDAKDMTLHEWTVAHQFLKQYIENPSEELEIKICAVVCRQYRPGKERVNLATYDGYPRLHFNEERIPYYEKKFAKLPRYIRYSVIEFMSRLLQMIQLRYGVMFQGEATGGTDWGWWGTIMNMSADDPTRMKEIKKMNLHEACAFICKQIIDEREREAKRSNNQ